MPPADPFHVVRNGMDAAPLFGSVIAIGNFDGVHRGHQAVIEAAAEMAARLDVPACAMTFEPHPRQLFQPDVPLFRLTAIETKLKLLEAAGLDGAVVATFDREFASQTAEAFIDDVLIGQFGVRGVAIGHNFHFGKKRGGNPQMLSEIGRKKGFEVAVVGPQGDDDTVFSSSAVRKHLGAGEIDEAAAILGYRWFFEGEVRHGEKRGRDLGYPTANMALDPACGLRHGVYAVRALIDGKSVGGVASFGIRPQFDSGAPLFETYLFDFNGDLYGKALNVSPLAFLRDEARFENLDALIAQMDTDAGKAREIIAALAKDDPVSGYPMAKAIAAMHLA